MTLHASPPPVRCPAPRWWSAPAIRELASVLATLPIGSAARQEALQAARTALSAAPLECRAAAAVLIDLSLHGWSVSGEGEELSLIPPVHAVDRMEEKARVQAQLAEEREHQVQERAVRAFIERMERPRLVRGQTRSIFSLFRDGRELAAQLREAAGDEGRVREAVRPYLQIIRGNERCEHSGMLLTDIWRYFRHTWATPYKSTPGRSMAVLVRDAAAPNHPVIGIALVGSPASQISCRDLWVGWSSEAVVDECRKRPSEDRVAWLHDTLRAELSELFCADLLADGIIAPTDLSNPKASTFSNLTAEAWLRRHEHRRFSAPAELKRASDAARGDDRAWERVAMTPLYRAKRAELLASLLRVRAAVAAFGPVTVDSLARFAGTTDGVTSIRTLARRSKARRMGVSVGEIAVCGAVSPYRELLGGKLVSLLAMSPAVRVAYATRYDEAESVIASATAGRAIRRQPTLALLMTTSLYASSASQYNRLRLPRSPVGGSGADLRYEEIGQTEGFGSSQFSDATIDLLALLLGQNGDGRRFNSVFGEGVNPRLRKAREGLELLGLPAAGLLKHGSARLVYAVPLADNFRRYLQGLDPEPEWSLPADEPEASTEAIAEWWRSRWLAARACRTEVLAEVARHTLTLPIRHGARVVLPADRQGRLFG